MATDSSILAWEVPWTEEPDKLQSVGSQRAGHTERLSTFTSTMANNSEHLFSFEHHMCHLCILLSEMTVHVLCPFPNWIFFFYYEFKIFK